MADEQKIGIEVETTYKGSGTDAAVKDLDKVEKKGQDVRKGFTQIGAAGAALGVGITAYAKNASDFTVGLATDTKKLSRETGLAYDESSRLLFVTQRLGIGTDQTSQSFGIFSKQIAANKDATAAWSQKALEAQNQLIANDIKIKEYTTEIKKNGDKTGELSNKIQALNLDNKKLHETIEGSASAFSKLGVQTEDAEGKTRSFNDILKDTADKFKTLPNGPEKTAIALDLFGRSGKDMIKVLNLGSQGIEDLEKRADQLGLTLNNKTIGAVSKYVESQKQLKETSDSLKIAVGTLTTPVLAAFNTKLNDIVQSLLKTDGPYRSIIANTLAFGGPILTASSGLVGFGANLATIGSSLGSVGGALSASASFLANPYVAAVGLAAVGAGLLTYQYYTQKTALEQLKVAQDNSKVSGDNLALSQDNVQRAELGVQQANINVTNAQNAYNDAVKRYGPNSAEAQQANINLKNAILDKKRAEDDAKKSLQDMQTAEQNYAKDKSFELAMARKADAVYGVQGALNSLQKSVNSQAKANGGKGNSLGGSGNLIQTLQQAFSGFASGGPVSGGEAIAVGDNPDGSWNRTTELFVPKRAGTVIPADESRRLMGGGGGAGGGDIIIQFTGPVYMTNEQEAQSIGNVLARQLQAARSGSY